MNIELPPERDLPNHQAMVDSILDEGSGRRAHRAGAMVSIAVATVAMGGVLAWAAPRTLHKHGPVDPGPTQGVVQTETPGSRSSQPPTRRAPAGTPTLPPAPTPTPTTPTPTPSPRTATPTRPGPSPVPSATTPRPTKQSADTSGGRTPRATVTLPLPDDHD